MKHKLQGTFGETHSKQFDCIFWLSKFDEEHYNSTFETDLIALAFKRLEQSFTVP